jgi:hypothetical protein
MKTKGANDPGRTRDADGAVAAFGAGSGAKIKRPWGVGVNP